MKTNIVYAVTSDNSDIYLEQTYLSIYSLRKFHPEAHVILVVDDKTDETISGIRKYIMEVVSEKVVIVPPNTYTKVERSRYLKTTLRNQIVGDYLFIDSDTIITDSLDEVDSMDGDICAVLDYHVTLDLHSRYETLIKRQAKSIGWIITEKDYRYFNSGVMFVRDSKIAHRLYYRWNEEWEKGRLNGLHSDQPSLGKVNSEMGYVIKELNGNWNCQIAENGLRFFEKAKIIHYFSSTIMSYETEYVYTLMDKAIFYPLKSIGKLDTKLMQMLTSPKELFNDKVKLISGINLSIYNSPLFYRIYVVFVRHSKFYRFLNKCCIKYESIVNNAVH